MQHARMEWGTTHLLNINGHYNFRDVGDDVALHRGYVNRLSHVAGHCEERCEVDMVDARSPWGRSGVTGLEPRLLARCGGVGSPA